LRHSSAIVPTVIAQGFFQPHGARELERDWASVPMEEVA
jgi:hypothetical protein